MECGDEIYLLVNRVGTILYATASIEKITGYLAEFLVGRTAADLMDDNDCESVMRLCKGERVTTEGNHYRVRHTDGSLVPVEVKICNHLDDPELQGVVMLFRPLPANVCMRDDKNASRCA
jgi:PAS domain S-box-containing protein